MKRFVLVLTFASLVIFSSAPTYGATEITLDNMTGLLGGDTVWVDSIVRWSFRLTNTDGETVRCISNGFRVWTYSGGANTDNFSPIVFDTFSLGWPDMFDLVFGISTFSIDGVGTDTVAFHGATNYGPGLPDGTDTLCWWIETTPAARGDTLCVDSSFWPPGGDWLWCVPSVGIVYPVWDGPYCFTVDSSCAEGDRDGDGIPDSLDNCWTTYNPLQEDTDTDSVGDSCDNCPYVYNPDQQNSDGDDTGDSCEVTVRYVDTAGSDENGDGSAGNPYATIQHAINKSGSDDTVLVAVGTYTGIGNRDIDFGGKDVRLLSSSGPSVTTIDCDGAGRAFYFHQGESSAAMVSGFTIMNGNSGSGGAILLFGYPDPVFPTITNCWFINNSANSGGAIYCSYFDPFPDPSTVISDCRFIGNSAWQGGAFGCFGGSYVIENCLFANNSATYGGALSLGLSIPMLRNCTIVQNTADSGAGIGYCETGAQAIQCIIAFNNVGASVRLCPPPAPGGNLALECCNIYGNEGGDWVDEIADQADTNGNFSLDPLFCDTASQDYSITCTSPCSPALNSCAQLIGAFGVACQDCLVRGDVDHNGSVNIADLSYLVTYLFLSGPAPPCPEEGDVDANGAINVVDLTYLVDYLFFSGPAPAPCP